MGAAGPGRQPHPADTSAPAPEPCSYDHQPSFILGSYRTYRPDLDRFDFSRYAPAGTSQQWSVVSPDAAALSRDTGPARAMMRYLASERGQSVRSAADGAFSAQTKVRVAEPGSVAGRISDIVAGRKDTKFCLDASDLMPTEMREAFYAGVRDHPARLDDRAAPPEILARLEEVRTRSRAQWDVTGPACSAGDRDREATTGGGTVPELVELELENGGLVAIEVRPGGGPERVGRGSRAVRDVRASFEEALGDVRDAAAAALAQFRQMPAAPDEVEITFGVKFDAQVGAVIARTGVEGNLRVMVKWIRPPTAGPTP